MHNNRFNMDDTSGVEDVGTEIVLINPTVLNDALSGGRTYFTLGAGGEHEQAPAVVLSESRNAKDVEAMERLRGR